MYYIWQAVKPILHLVFPRNKSGGKKCLFHVLFNWDRWDPLGRAPQSTPLWDLRPEHSCCPADQSSVTLGCSESPPVSSCYGVLFEAERMQRCQPLVMWCLSMTQGHLHKTEGNILIDRKINRRDALNQKSWLFRGATWRLCRNPSDLPEAAGSLANTSVGGLLL